MPKRLLIIIVPWIVALSACGTAQDERQPASGQRAAPQDPRNALELPAGVPLRPTGPAVAAQAGVVRAWTAALRAGDIEAASALWAVPSKVQNGTPVVTLTSTRAVRAFNAALPCGSVVTSAGRAGDDFTIATMRLTARKGAQCDAAAGATARTAIRVRAGKIVEWYRLPDDPDAPGLLPPPDDGESTTI
ncbi:MAG: hypothetical protein WKF48_00365 [Solirubrobacteraceae bacterium]